MSKHEEADLILKLYELRKEENMRTALEWYFEAFNPTSAKHIHVAMFGPHSKKFRIVTAYWDMAAALVNHGAISVELFNDAGGEHYVVFAKIAPLLKEAREIINSRFFVNLEKLIDATPNGRQIVAAIGQAVQKNIAKAA